MKNKLLTISKIGLLAFTILVSQACQEDYEMVDPPMITDYDDDLDEEVVLQKGLESYFVTQFGEGDMDGTSWDQAMDVAGFRKFSRARQASAAFGINGALPNTATTKVTRNMGVSRSHNIAICKEENSQPPNIVPIINMPCPKVSARNMTKPTHTTSNA